jgi:hypothetical protein
MRDTVRRAACYSSLGAAQVLPPPAAAVGDAVLCVSSSCLGAAHLLAAPAATMRDAMLRAACSSSLGAAHLLTTPAATMRNAVLRAKWSGCSTRAAAAEVFVVVVRFMGPLMGGLWV